MPTERDENEASVAAGKSSDASAPTVAAPLVDSSQPTLAADYSTTVAHISQTFVGTTVGNRYFIEKELGQGGVGAVYLAQDRKLLDKKVVVKVLLEKSLRNERIVQKFKQEKEALTRVDHPGIIGILDTGELDDGKPYIVMQYVDGVNLRSALFPEGMLLERVASIVSQMGRALAAAHEKGIFHRDLKPENIMLQHLSAGEEQVRIIDFGVAKIKNSLVALSTVTPTTLGTYGYMSPEQFRGERVTAASDIYSLGVISYEMVTGRRPFNPEGIGQLGEVQREGVRVKPKDLRPALPEAAQDVILRALEFEPSARYEDAREFGDGLSQALLDQGRGPVRSLARNSLAETVTDAVKPVLPAPSASQASRVSFSLNTSWLKVAVSFVFVAAFVTAIFGVFTFQSLRSTDSEADSSSAAPTSGAFPNVSSGSTANANDVSESRSFKYWLTVQKMRDDKPYQAPFKSSGGEIFESGYKFQLNFYSAHAGYLYVFNEGAAAGGGTSFHLIHPTPPRNKGSAFLSPRQPVQTGWNVFGGQPGTEQFWLIWSSSPVDSLEAARESAFKTDDGSIKDAALVNRVREFLFTNGKTKPTVFKDTSQRETVVRGSEDPLVSLVELEHR